MDNFFETISQYITADYIALISVIITVLIFVFSRKSELKYKKHEDKKNQYVKLIKLMEDIFTNASKNKKNDFKITREIQKQFFDAGSSLLLYGSKKLYKNYLFFREFSTNPLIPLCKYYQENLIIYLIADILTTMRKEVGLSNFNNIPSHEALGFFVNDISNNPIAKVNAYDAIYRIKMIKLELLMIDMVKFIGAKYIFYKLIKPIWGFFSITFKYLFMIPLGKALIWLFPKFAAKCQNENQNNHSI
ncbi:MAG: hypothetical protein VR67_15620 [Peptococcaceae bacterium BRH_c8a]|nr:MAG: hypothetical protein VR67_15620 [Peptococcaceae bacterium BRH_c8a]